jgi:hypothetical protein
MTTIPSVIQSVYTDGILRSIHTDGITNDIFMRIKKKRWFVDVEVFPGDCTNGITEGFKPGSPYSDVTKSPSELPMESPT